MTENGNPDEFLRLMAEMEKDVAPKDSPGRVIFKVLLNMFQLAVTTWAAVETSGVLSILLWTIVGLFVVSFVFLAAVGHE